jgi:two-component system, LytTR family, sensor kinase
LSTSILSTFRFRWLFFSAWLLWALLHAWVVYSFNQSWLAALTDSVVSNGLLLLVALLLINTLRYYVPQSDRYIMLLVWVLVLCICWLFFSRIILSVLLHTDGYMGFLKSSLLVRFSIGFLITSIIVLLSVTWYNWQEQKTLQARESETDKLAKDAELYKLRQQLQPHFLFNSLNSINALITVQPAEARKMVLQLSDFLRGTLKKEERQWVALQEEIEHLQLYLEIEKVRFGHRLSTRFDIEEPSKQLKLPALVLQPLVENAIKFGLYDTTEAITISIGAEKKNHHLVITVQNPFDAETSGPKGTGFGLSSVQRRLYLLFGRNDLLTTTTKENIFITQLTIPQLQNEPV